MKTYRSFVTLQKMTLLGHKTLSHLSVHMVNRLLRENRKTIPKFLSGEKLFKKCHPSDFKFYPSKLAYKKFPHMV